MCVLYINDDFVLLKNEELCIKNEGFCIENDDLWGQVATRGSSTAFCRWRDFALKMMDFALKMMDFAFKVMDFVLNYPLQRITIQMPTFFLKYLLKMQR